MAQHSLRGAPESVRFFAAVGPADANGCWPWMGFKIRPSPTRAGCRRLPYGRFDVWSPTLRKVRTFAAHRHLWSKLYGRIPKGRVVMHTCDNASCVNPEHLQLGTQRQNVHDARRKGRLPVGTRMPTHKLTDADIVEIRRRRAQGEYCHVIGKDFGVSHMLVSFIARGKRWRHVPRNVPA